MTITRIAPLALALLVAATPALAQRHADVVYLNQLRAQQQKVLAKGAKPAEPQLAKAPEARDAGKDATRPASAAGNGGK